MHVSAISDRFSIRNREVTLGFVQGGDNWPSKLAAPLTPDPRDGGKWHSEPLCGAEMHEITGIHLFGVRGGGINFMKSPETYGG